MSNQKEVTKSYQNGGNQNLLRKRQIVIPFLLLIFVSLVVCSGYAYLVTKALDTQEITQKKHLAESAVAFQLEILSNWSYDYAYWDETIANVVESLDHAWANGNIGQYLYDSYGIDQSYVLGTDDRTIIAYREGEELPTADLLEDFPPEIKILLQHTRASSPQEPEPASGMFLQEGQLVLVATAVVTPEDPGPEVRSDLPRPVLVLVRTLSDELLENLAHRFLLPELKLGQPDSRTAYGAMPLRDPAGNPLVELQWRLDAPGSVLAYKLLPMFPVALLLIILITLQFLSVMERFWRDKQKSEKAYAVSEERLSIAMEASGDGLWDWDIHGQQTYFDSRYYTMLAYTPNEFPAIHDNFLARIHPEDRAAVEQALNSHLSGESPRYECEFRALCKDSSIIWVLARGKVVSYDAQGNPLRMIGTHTDITERKSVEAEQARLEAVVRQTHKMEAVGIMAGGIAHDFNNLLSIISGNLDLVRHKYNTGVDSKENLDNIGTASDRATELVKQILAFSHQGKRDFAPIDFSIAVDDTLKLLRSTAPATVEILRKVDCGTIIINADTTQLQQVMINIFTNAIHAMDGKGLLRIGLNDVNVAVEQLSARTGCQPGRYAKLSISDTGTGISKETVDKIFDPFFTTKKVGEGTGMGLSVAHGIIEQHGGFITVDSSIGQGTTFNVYLPTSKEVEAKMNADKVEILPYGTEKILFVDDEECIAHTCSELLEGQGYKVTSVLSGIEAVELFKTNPGGFDLVFTDQTMPQMSGTELATELLKIRPDIPIILCSGYSAKTSKIDAEKIGIREFCTKPMNIEHLAKVVRKVLDKSAKGT
jgi:PAS domain S-box-containing protein